MHIWFSLIGLQDLFIHVNSSFLHESNVKIGKKMSVSVWCELSETGCFLSSNFLIVMELTNDPNIVCVCQCVFIGVVCNQVLVKTSPQQHPINNTDVQIMWFQTWGNLTPVSWVPVTAHLGIGMKWRLVEVFFFFFFCFIWSLTKQEAHSSVHPQRLSKPPSNWGQVCIQTQQVRNGEAPSWFYKPLSCGCNKSTTVYNSLKVWEVSYHLL